MPSTGTDLSSEASADGHVSCISRHFAWWAPCFGGHFALADMLHWWTCCIGGRLALVDMTRECIGLNCGTCICNEISGNHHDRNVVCMIGGRTTGEQKLNGMKKTKATLARVMGYVEQSDIHTPALTVIESLTFSAHLRLPRNVNKRSEAKFVDNVRPLLLQCIAILSKARWLAVIHTCWIGLQSCTCWIAAISSWWIHELCSLACCSQS